MTTTLKRLSVTDVNELREISIETFTDTFGAQNTPENLRDYLADAYQESVLVKELENAESLFYFVMVDDEIAGYLKLNVGDAQPSKLNASMSVRVSNAVDWDASSLLRLKRLPMS